MAGPRARGWHSWARSSRRRNARSPQNWPIRRSC